MKVTGIQHYRAQFAAVHALFPKVTMQVRAHVQRSSAQAPGAGAECKRGRMQANTEAHNHALMRLMALRRVVQVYSVTW